MRDEIRCATLTSDFSLNFSSLKTFQGGFKNEKGEERKRNKGKSNSRCNKWISAVCCVRMVVDVR